MKKLLFAFVLLASCAPSGPWPISTEAERDERLPKVGMSSGEVWGKLGQAMRAPNDFVTSFLPGPGYDGLAYYPIKGLTLRVAEVRFEAGVVKDVRYVPRRPAATATSGVMYADGEASASEEPPSNVVTFARTCTWDGGGADALASNAVNWDTDTAPVAGDSIVFPTTTKSCTWDLNLSLVAFTVNSGYVQTITQNSGANFTFSGAFAVNGACTITCNAGATTTTGAFSVAAGTFNQGGAFTSTTFAVTATGNFQGGSATMSTTAVTFSGTGGGSTLRATSNIWTLAGSWTQSTALTTFTANSGTINITAASTFNDARSTFNLVTINSGLAVTISASTTCPLGTAPTTNVGVATLTVSGSVTWSGLWTITGTLSATGTLTGTGSPTIAINQSLTTSSATITNAIGTVTFNGTLSSTYTDTGDKLSGTTFAVNKTSTGAFTIAASTNARFGASPTLTLGSGAVSVTGTFTWSGAATFATTGGMATGATGVLTGTGSPTISSPGSININATTTVTNTISTVTFTSGTTPTYTDTGDKLSASTVVLTAGSNTVIAASTICRLGASPTSTSGTNTLTVTGEVRWSGPWTHTGTITVTTTTGTLTGTGTPTLALNQSLTIGAASVITNAIGTVTFNGTTASTHTDTGDKLSGTTFVITKSAAANVTVAASTTMRLGASPTIELLNTNTFTVTGTATMSGAVIVHGSISIGAAGTISGAVTSMAFQRDLTITAGGAFPATVPLTFTGSAISSQLNAPGITFGTCTISKTNQTFTVAASTVCPLGANPTTSCGTSTYTSTGTTSVSGTWTHAGLLTVGATGTVSGALTNLTLNRALTVTAGGVFPASIPVAWNGVSNSSIDAAGISFGTWTINVGAAAVNLTIASGTTIPLGNNPDVTCNQILVNGILDFSGSLNLHHANQGNLVIGATGNATGGFTDITLTGNWTDTAGGTFPTGIKFHATGGNIQVWNATSYTYGTCSVLKSAAEIQIGQGNSIPFGANPVTTAGRLTASGTVVASGPWTHTGDFVVGSLGVLSGITQLNMTDGLWSSAATGTLPAGLNITMSFTGATAYQFQGGNLTYGAVRRAGSGSSMLTVTGSNTFADFRDNDGLVDHTIQFTAGTTQTITSSSSQYMIDGGAAHVVTLSSTTPATPFILHTTGAKPINLKKCAISDCTVDVSPEWFAGDYALANGGGNTNLKFVINPRLRKF